MVNANRDNKIACSQRPPGATPKTHLVNELTRKMNKRQKWVRADKLQPGDRVQDAKGKIVTIKEVSQGIFPGSILVTLQDADPDFLYLESDTKVFVE